MYAGRSWGYLAGITPNDLKLLTAVLVVAALALSRSRENIALRRSLSGKRYATEAARAKGGSK